jgi:asparagine synthase (glutamine-hydrolysing)
MCGFAGILSTRALTHAELSGHARAMIDPIAHRGPDDSGLWVDPHAGVAFGFRRLAILDLSEAGHQPMTSPSGRYVIAFNGEVYNFAELRRSLEAHGHAFRGGSDTEVILTAFEQWGLRAAIERFVGMFAMAVWDGHRRELSLVRDRLGKKPLYVHHQPGLIAFGSEIKALAAGPAFDRSIDRAALASYLRYLYVPAPRTIFRSTIKLPPAHVLTIRSADEPLPATECYWSLRDAAADGLRHTLAGDPVEIVEQLDRLLTEAVRCRLHADVPLGALLSGGIDSSTIVALMQEGSTRPVRTYTIGFDEHEFDESAHAARIARHLGTAHTELQLTGDDACSVVPQLADIFDEPFADPSQVPTLLVSRLARQHVTVALCGDGGDELFGGYNRYVYGARVLPRLDRVPYVVRRSVAAGLACVPAVTWDCAQQLAAAVAPGLPARRMGERMQKLRRLMVAVSTGEMYRTLLSAWQRPELLIGHGEVESDSTADILNSSNPSDLLDRMMLADQTMYLPDDLLAKVDRASMAVSLEVRAPLLDHRVVEFSWRIPRSLKLRGTQAKWALRQVLYRRVPRDLVERPKMGFSVPIDTWLRGPLKPWAQDLLFGHRADSDDWLDRDAIARTWTDLQHGREYAGMAIWAVVMLHAWRARWATA